MYLWRELLEKQRHLMEDVRGVLRGIDQGIDCGLRRIGDELWHTEVHLLQRPKGRGPSDSVDRRGRRFWT